MASMKTTLEIMRDVFGDLNQNFASIALSGSGDVVNAVTGKMIRVIALCGAGTTTGSIKFQSGATSDLTGAMRINDGTPLNLPFNPSGWFQTVSGEKLNAVLATMTAFNGCLIYVEI